MNQPIDVIHFWKSHAKEIATSLAVGTTLFSSIATITVKLLSDRLLVIRNKLILDKVQAGSSSRTNGELGSALFNRVRTRDSAHIPSPPSASEVAQNRVRLRIAEAESMRKQQLGLAKSFRTVANGLTWTNFILGGVLASSFVQETVSSKWTGLLGVLVLISSLIRQHYHPDIDAQMAEKKALQLNALIRPSEDRLAILEAKTAIGEDHSDDLVGLMQWLSQRLGEIEGSQEDAAQPPKGRANVR